VMDRGYLDFRRLFAMHQAGAFFVTRARSAMNARRVYSAVADHNRGVICDQRVMLEDRKTSKKYPEQIRRIRFKDPDSGKTLVFLTNNTALPALTIAALYKSRWQVELFFKWIKQHLRIKRFLATSENAVKTQIWCAIATYVLIAIVKKEAQAQRFALYLSTDSVGLDLRENRDFMRFAASPFTRRSTIHPNQLILFEI
jgi:IS4 transposase